MCAIGKFLLYCSSIFDIVMINDKSTHLFVDLLVYYACMLGSRKYVSMVHRYNLLVRKVVPTLTSKSVEIYLSMAGAKQLVTQGLSWFRPGPYVQQ
jgi:hypothetical protein